MKSKTRSILTVCLALALVAAAVLGTIAYMTAQDSKTNTFTVGSFNKPTTDPDNPDQTLDGYLSEPSWVEDSKLVPGGSVDKDPKVGIGAGSEDAYIYVYVENKTLTDANKKLVTFTLNDDWTAVAGNADDADDADNTYVSGLFKYNTKLTGTGTGDNWTSKVFTKVDVSANANTTDFAEEPQMTVYAYIHQATDGAGVDDLATTAETAAIIWSANPTGN